MIPRFYPGSHRGGVSRQGIAIVIVLAMVVLLAAIVLHRIETYVHLGSTLHAHLHHTAITISLEAVAIAGLVVSSLLWILVAIATPLPGLVSDLLQQRIPPEIRERIMKNAA